MVTAYHRKRNTAKHAPVMSLMTSDSDKPRESDQPVGVNLLVRMMAEIAFSAHLVVAAIYWWLSPQGFPVDHCRFWLNSVVPLATMTVAVVGLTGMLRPHYPTAMVAALSFASAWIGGALAGQIVFPLSLHRFGIFGVTVGLIAVGLILLVFPWDFRTLRKWNVFFFPSALIGVFVIWAQLPPTPSTNPLATFPAGIPSVSESSSSKSAVEVGKRFLFRPTSGEFVLRHDNIRLAISPLLDFDRISPDKFWSILAPPAAFHPRRLHGGYASSNGIRFCKYSDDAMILVRNEPSAAILEVDCFTPVEQDSYSHLNSFSVLEVTGHKQLSLTFSPCPETNIDVLPADYPTGRPARFAYLNRSGEFHVVEATSGEKGPFHRLASGPLARDDPFSITLFDREAAVATIAFEDWPAQASTAISPTAGWGVPVNAIEFQRHGDNESSPVTIWITLASTSVGRGWDVVGHQAGIYRNRIRVTTNIQDNPEEQ